MRVERIRWQQARSISRQSPRSIGRGGTPTDPGVYIWFKNDEPIYVGEALGKKGLRGRIRSHRDALTQGSPGVIDVLVSARVTLNDLTVDDAYKLIGFEVRGFCPENLPKLKA